MKYATHGYDFYFGTIRLPVTPSSINFVTPSKNETVTLINNGEINIVRDQGLREISFSFMLPHEKYPFVKSQDDENMTKSLVSSGVSSAVSGAVYGYMFGSAEVGLSTAVNSLVDSASSLGEGLTNKAKFSPAYFMPLLEDLKKYKQVIPFKVYRNDVNVAKSTAQQVTNQAFDILGANAGKLLSAGVVLGKSYANQQFNKDKIKLPNTSINVVIEDLEFEEDADSYGRDIMCNITLKEWKPYSTKTYKINKNNDGTKTVNATKQRAVTKATTESVVVKKGDTLWNLCKKHLGDGQKYKEVAKLNGISNPNLIYPGNVIRFK